jgi:urease accessory protein
MDARSFLSLLQFSDGLFPAGSYAHSLGLESCVQEGGIHDARGVESFLISYLQGSLAPTDVVAMLASQAAAEGPASTRMQRCVAIDRDLDVMKPARELREASRQMGRQVLRIAGSLGGLFASHDLVTSLLAAVEDGQTPGHHPVAFGVAGAILAWPEKEMIGAYLYSTCATLVSASLRLLPLGQTAGQRILWSLGAAIETLVDEAVGKNDLRDVWSFSPKTEIAAMRHEILDGRLFRS